MTLRASASLVRSSTLLLALVALPLSGQQGSNGTLAERGLSAADFPELTQVGEGIYTWTDVHPAGRIVTNSLIVLTDEGVLVADGQSNPEATGRMLAGIRELTAQPVRWVVVCSDHGDHTGGNSAFPEDAVFIAHPTSRANLEATAANPNRSADAPPVRIPSELVSDRRVMTLGGREIHILFGGRAHTGETSRSGSPGSAFSS